jgi:hypothetical protein
MKFKFQEEQSKGKEVRREVKDLDKTEQRKRDKGGHWKCYLQYFI